MGGRIKFDETYARLGSMLSHKTSEDWTLRGSVDNELEFLNYTDSTSNVYMWFSYMQPSASADRCNVSLLAKVAPALTARKVCLYSHSANAAFSSVPALCGSELSSCLARTQMNRPCAIGLAVLVFQSNSP